MGLIVEPWYFTNYVDNFGTTPASLHGTTVTPGVLNADGTAAQLLAAQTFDIYYIVVGLAGYNATGTAMNALADILIDPAGGTAWKVLISGLVCGFTGGYTAGVQATLMYRFPIYIEAGATIGCQTQVSAASPPSAGITKVTIQAYGPPSRPDVWWCGAGVETLGVTAATSTAVSVTPGNTGAYGNWATIGTSTARYGSIQMGLNGVDSNMNAAQYFFQVGRNNVAIPSHPTMAAATTTLEAVYYSYMYGPTWCDIPSGTALQVRGTCSGTAEVWAGGAAIYGVY